MRTYAAMLAAALALGPALSPAPASAQTMGSRFAIGPSDFLPTCAPVYVAGRGPNRGWPSNPAGYAGERALVIYCVGPKLRRWF